MPKDTANDLDYTIEALDFGGEQVTARLLELSGTKIAALDGAALHRKESFTALIRATIQKSGVEDIRDVPTLVQKATATQALMVSEDAGADILDASREAETGQMQLLSTEGEARQAARVVADRVVEAALFSYGADDQLPTLGDLVGQARADLDRVTDPEDDDADLDQVLYLAELAAAHALVPVLWARAMIAREQAAKEAELAAERARHAKADADGNVPTPGEVDGDEALDDAVRESSEEGDD